MHGHALGGLEADPRVGQRMGNGLVLADRAVEHDTVLGVLDGDVQGGAADADLLHRDDDALGVEPVDQVVEALADLADDLVVTDREVVDEQLVGVERRPAELLDLPDGDVVAVEVGEEDRHPVERVGLVTRRRAGEQQDLVRRSARW